MKIVNEGNLYNIETEISRTQEPTVVGIENWKKEVKKQLIQSLYNKNIKDLNPILLQVFGTALD